LIFLLFSLARFRALDFNSLFSLLIFRTKQTNNNQQPKENNIWPKHSPKPKSPRSSPRKTVFPRKQAVEILDYIAALAYKHAKDTFTLPGIGKLVLKNRAARIGRNPKTGEQIQIKAKRVVKFRVAKAAKDAILGTK
jgi:DNA-binding protein HU-beta